MIDPVPPPKPPTAYCNRHQVYVGAGGCVRCAESAARYEAEWACVRRIAREIGGKR